MEKYIKEENKMGFIRDEIIKFFGGVPKDESFTYDELMSIIMEEK